MKNRALARRYARALFELGRERELLGEFEAQLRLLRRVLADSPRLRVMFEHPQVSQREKFRAIEEFFADRVSAPLLNLLRLLVVKHRERYLDLIHEAFREAYDEARGIGKARVRVATRLPEATLERVREALSAAFDRDMRLEVEVDDDLIGGIVVQVGDRRLDASVRRRLESLRRHIAAGGAETEVSEA